MLRDLLADGDESGPVLVEQAIPAFARDVLGGRDEEKMHGVPRANVEFLPIENAWFSGSIDNRYTIEEAGAGHWRITGQSGEVSGTSKGELRPRAAEPTRPPETGRPPTPKPAGPALNPDHVAGVYDDYANSAAGGPAATTSIAAYRLSADATGAPLLALQGVGPADPESGENDTLFLATVPMGVTTDPEVTAGHSITWASVGSWTGMVIRNDPGQPVIWLAFGLLIAGLVLTFYFPRRRAWAREIWSSAARKTSRRWPAATRRARTGSSSTG